MEAFLYTGAAFGLALGASILPFRRRDAMEKWLTGFLLIIGGCAAAAITLQHQLSAFDRGGLLEIFEIGTGLAAGPLLYRFCSRRSRRSKVVPFALHFVPALAASFLIAANGRFPLPIAWMVFHQVAYTVMSIRATVADRAEGIDGWAIQLCAAAVSIHLAQFVRMTFTDVAALRNIVPITIVGGFCVLAFLSLRRLLDSSLGVSLHARYVRSSLGDADASELESRLGAVMANERPWLDCNLSLDQLAAAAGASPHHLSELLNAKMGTSFNELVARHRLEEARQRLADPANDRYTIEAIAESSGFASRSSFYAAFRRAFGTTPTRYRAEARALSR